jgi:hypothetical protein
MVDFPAGIPDIPDANPSETLAVMHAGLGHSPVTNRILLNLEQLAAKLGTGASTPGATAAVLRRTAANVSAWGALQPTDITPGTAGYVLQTGAAANPLWVPWARKNLLLNGQMKIHQRAALSSGKTTVDWSYQTTDRWKTVWDSAGVAGTVYAYPLGPPPINARSILLQSQGNTAKFGMVQVLEAIDTAPLLGQVVSVQANIVSAGSFSDIRMALLSWSGTGDAPTDPIGTWNASGANPSPSANWGFIGVPANLGVTAAPQVFRIENQVVPTNCQNLAVILWSNSAVNTAGNSWYVTDVQLELGTACSAVERVPWALEHQLCQRYYEKSYQPADPPGTNGGLGGEMIYHLNPVGAATAGNGWISNTPRFRVQKRTTPTVALYHSTGALNTLNYGGTTPRAGVTLGVPSTNAPCGYLAMDATAGTPAVSAGVQSYFQWTADAEL